MKKYSVVSLIRSLILLVILLTGTSASTAQAYDVHFFQGNDILYYNPDDTGPCPAGGTTGQASAALAGNSNAEKIWNFLVSGVRGLTAEQAAGIMGNIQKESGFDPAIEERSGGGGYGIVQWTGSRRTQLEAAAARQGVPVSDLGFQLEYLYQESNSRQVTRTVAAQGYGTAGANEWATHKQQKTIQDATVFWHNNFEVSDDSPQDVLRSRGAYAEEAYNTFKDTAPTGGTATSSTSNGCASSSTFGGGDLTQTTLAYAWPTWHAPDYPNKKLEYEAAVQKAISEGRFVGGLEYPGVDCGGFITTLMIDSGFEPRYNYSGKGGNTDSQEAWAQENWKTLGKGSTINVADLKPGDVAFQPGHTFVFVGQIDGFQTNIASASVSFGPGSWRAPMAGMENPTNPTVTWYRKG